MKPTETVEIAVDDRERPSGVVTELEKAEEQSSKSSTFRSETIASTALF
jgi:hypothetical protein